MTSNTIVAIILFIIAILGVLATPVIQYVECGTVCEAQKAERMWTFTQGCYCQDGSGAYNPKDERQK